MSLQKDEKISSLFVRWDEQGELKGAFVTRLTQIFENGELISAKESKPIPVEMEDFENQKHVSDVIGQLQVDQLLLVKEKENELKIKEVDLKEKSDEVEKLNKDLEEKNLALLEKIDRLKEKTDNLNEKIAKLIEAETDIADKKEKIDRLQEKIALRDKAIEDLIEENGILKKRLK